ncbi:hypothetical protein BDR26DRAFT_931032 [Obelidium mucronatum]|nr:hypothetical protein BDR26DRAFT_931032 [Obelidium mucronatum]
MEDQLEELRRLEQLQQHLQQDTRPPCPFFAKVGACRYGNTCSRAHLYPPESTVMLILNMHQDALLIPKSRPLATLEDEELGDDEIDEKQLEANFIEFFQDTHPEFLNVGNIVQFKLRGNVYVQYSTPAETATALQKFNGRFFGGIQLSCHLGTRMGLYKDADYDFEEVDDRGGRRRRGGGGDHHRDSRDYDRDGRRHRDSRDGRELREHRDLDRNRDVIRDERIGSDRDRRASYDRDNERERGRMERGGEDSYASRGGGRRDEYRGGRSRHSDGYRKPEEYRRRSRSPKRVESRDVERERRAPPPPPPPPPPKAPANEYTGNAQRHSDIFSSAESPSGKSRDRVDRNASTVFGAAVSHPLSQPLSQPPRVDRMASDVFNVHANYAKHLQLKQLKQLQPVDCDDAYADDYAEPNLSAANLSAANLSAAKPAAASSFDNIFSDPSAGHAKKASHHHHRHTNIFNDNLDPAPSPRASAASRNNYSSNYASNYMQDTGLPPAPVSRMHSSSSSGIFPTSFGDTVHYSDAPKSGRRHFNNASSTKSSIFDYSNEDLNFTAGSAAPSRRASGLARSNNPSYQNSSNTESFYDSASSSAHHHQGILPTERDFFSSRGGHGVAAMDDDSGRAGGLSSSDLNRERFGRGGRRQAFEQSQIFF